MSVAAYVDVEIPELSSQCVMTYCEILPQEET